MKFRKFNKSLMAISLAALYTVSTFGAAVTDVTSTHWAYSSVVSLEQKGIISYNSKGQFFPNKQMNYFEVVDVLAKATGYVDVDIATNVDDAFRTQIKNNYQKQKPIIDTYSAKYSSWDKLYNQQIAYLLGRGYLSQSDLDVFISKSGNTQAQAKITKQDLAVLLVRILGKEVTAKSTYTSTGFKDESAIATAKRPHVAYLKKLGVIAPDTKGNMNPNMVVTKALCAKMVNDVVKLKDIGSTSTNNTSNNTSNSTSNSTSNNTSTTNPNSAVAQNVVVKKILTKNTTEYFLYLEKNGNSSYYSIKNTTQVTDANGNPITISNIPLESAAVVTISLEGTTEYVTSMKLGTSANNNGNSQTQTGTTTATVVGTLLQNSSNNLLRLSLSDGTSKAYILSEDCTITLDGVKSNVAALNEGDKIVASVQNSTITSIQAIKGTGSANVTTSNSGEVMTKQTVLGGYNIVLQSGRSESTVFIPESTSLKRNNKNKDLTELRIGDEIQLTKEGNTVTGIIATGEQRSIEGTIKEIHLAQPGRIVVSTGSSAVTYTLTDSTEIYDNNTRKTINIRDLHLGQEVELLLESKEVVSLDVVKGTNTVNFKGTIQSVSDDNDYIDVLIDYDPISGATGLYKRVEVSTQVAIMKNSSEVSRSKLEEDMDIVITYEYLDDASPKKILIIG